MKKPTMTVNVLAKKVGSLEKTVTKLAVEVKNLAVEMRNGFTSIRSEMVQLKSELNDSIDGKIDQWVTLTMQEFQAQREFMQQKFHEQGEDIYVLKRDSLEMKCDIADIKATLGKVVL